MPSFSIALSGLKASQQALSVVANNLSNMNTVGYKDQTANFRDLFYQTVGTNGSGDSLQVGAGTMLGATTTDFSDGNVATNNVSSDVAISGNGFFVTQLNGKTEYTRAGNFQVDNNGYLTTQDGQNVMGYGASGGVVNTSTLTPLQINLGSMVPATATGSLQMTTNLKADADTGTVVTNPMNVYDSLGTSHLVTFTFTKTGTDTWSFKATLPTDDLNSATSTTTAADTTTIASGNMTFGADGGLTGLTLDSTSTGTVKEVSSSNTNPASISGVTVSGLADGASDLKFDWNLTDSSNKAIITQTSASSGTSASSQTGYPSGTLESYSIQADGTVEGTCSNGQSLALGQLVLAQFANVQGLNRAGDNAYEATVSSGQAVVGAPEAGGRGKLTGDALEQSNVDMATEFSQMIVNQRGFEANAKVISAFDQVTQDTIQMQR